MERLTIREGNGIDFNIKATPKEIRERLAEYEDTAEFKADWIVDDVETIEAWMPVQKQPDLYERRK